VTPPAWARLRIAGLLVVAVVVQSTFGDDLRLLGGAPDLMLLLAICAGLTGGPEVGAVTGFVAGLLADVTLSTTPLGLCALTWCAVGWGVGTLRTNLLPDSRTVAAAIAVVATAAGVVLFLLFGDLVGQSQLIAYGRSYLLRTTVIEAFWSALLVVPVLAVFARAARGLVGVDALRRPEALAPR
jgi:rod shape-determining protein MreD